METLLRKEKKICANVDTLEMAFRKVADEVNTLLEINDCNKQSSDSISKQLKSLRCLTELYSSLSLNK